jgi:bifunctional DNase/RNase
VWYVSAEAGEEPAMWVQMTVSTILFDSKNSSYIVVLKDETGKKILPIWIGAAEGNSIALAMSKVKASRPLTHDLIVSIFDRLEVEIARVVISDLIDNTFYASLYLLQNNKEFHIDSRPSDAIAVAIRTGAPVFVEEDVLAKQDQSTLDTWMKNLGESGGTEYNA